MPKALIADVIYLTYSKSFPFPVFSYNFKSNKYIRMLNDRFTNTYIFKSFFDSRLSSVKFDLFFDHIIYSIGQEYIIGTDIDDTFILAPEERPVLFVLRKVRL